MFNVNEQLANVYFTYTEGQEEEAYAEGQEAAAGGR